MSCVYWPQANGTIERWNPVLKDCIQSAEKLAWEPEVTFLYNYSATPHTTRCRSYFKVLRRGNMRAKLKVSSEQESAKKHKQHIYLSQSK